MSPFDIESDLRVLVYYDGALRDWHREPLPGLTLASALDARKAEIPDFDRYRAKLEASCRKLCLMQYAIKRAETAEQRVYEMCFPDAMAWFGEEQVELNFYLEGAVLFARAALDIITPVFSVLMPDPLPRMQTNSFNEFTKRIAKVDSEADFIGRCKRLREGEEAWFGWLVGSARGRSMRDKIVHQTEFPLTSLELNLRSERETLVVDLGSGWRTPKDFFQELVDGVCAIFLDCEKEAVAYLLTGSPIPGL